MATDISSLSIAYFRPPNNYFWQWAEKGEVIEWRGGPTICYRDELMILLSGLASRDLSIPALGTVLLMLSACQESWKGLRGGKEALAGFQNRMEFKVGRKKGELSVDSRLLNRVMDLIHQLPADLRTGTRKIHLAHEVFENADNPVSADLARLLIAEFGTGRLDYAITTSGDNAADRQFQTDSARLILAFRKYQHANGLQLKLQTGLEALPQPAADLSLPAADAPELLDQLAEDTRTAGIARITRRLLPVLHFPMHAQSTSDLPLGGVSDISNRGSFDRLLLSELANEDLVLTARLVNGEALYLRREEPPVPQERALTVLLDTTLKMWGLPRVFALSAALACARQKQRKGAVKVMALGGASYETVDISTQEGVVEALGKLDPALHGGLALKNYLGEMTNRKVDDVLLIGGEDWLLDARLLTILTECRGRLRFLITVNRKGELAFYEFVKGGRKEISSARLDLNELLSTPTRPKPVQYKPDNKSLPAFLRMEQPPLFFPTAHMRISKHNTFYDSKLGLVGITELQRVLYWSDKDTGAKELLGCIEEGEYCFGYDGESTVFITVNDPKNRVFRLYRLVIRENLIEELDYSEQAGQVRKVVYQDLSFYLKPETGFASIDCTSGRWSNLQYSENLSKVFGGQFQPELNTALVKRLINNGYTVLLRVEKICLSGFGEIMLDFHRIELINHNFIRLSEDRKELERTKFAKETQDVSLLSNSRIRFRRWGWADGSEAVLDARGFLHLRSSNTSIPEITIVLLLGKTTSGWAADGTTFGSPYFLGKKPVKCISAPAFYKNYMQKFIDHLRE